MYCPICFNDSLNLSQSGVVHLIINGKQMDAGRFLFNLEDEKRKQETTKALITKVREFFQWYSNFQNKEPISVIELVSSDFSCDTGCVVPSTNKYSIIDVVVERSELEKILKEEGDKYLLEIKLHD